MQKEMNVSLLRHITNYYPYTLVIPIFSTMEMPLRAESSARNFPKTWNQPDSFIQHHQTFKVKLLLKKYLLWILPICIFFIYLFTTTFKNISLDSKDKTSAKIFFFFLCAFSWWWCTSLKCIKTSILGQQKDFRLPWNHLRSLEEWGKKKNPTKLHCSQRTHLVFPHFAVSISQSFKCKIIYS